MYNFLHASIQKPRSNVDYNGRQSTICRTKTLTLHKMHFFLPTDVDECARTPKPCRTECVNTPGSYRCRCPVGYQQISGVCQGLHFTLFCFGLFSFCYPFRYSGHTYKRTNCNKLAAMLFQQLVNRMCSYCLFPAC
jgi:hypothetical protein